MIGNIRCVASTWRGSDLCAINLRLLLQYFHFLLFVLETKMLPFRRIHVYWYLWKFTRCSKRKNTVSWSFFSLWIILWKMFIERFQNKQLSDVRAEYGLESLANFISFLKCSQCFQFDNCHLLDRSYDDYLLLIYS